MTSARSMACRSCPRCSNSVVRNSASAPSRTRLAMSQTRPVVGVYATPCISKILVATGRRSRRLPGRVPVVLEDGLGTTSQRTRPSATSVRRSSSPDLSGLQSATSHRVPMAAVYSCQATRLYRCDSAARVVGYPTVRPRLVVPKCTTREVSAGGTAARPLQPAQYRHRLRIRRCAP